MLFGRAVSSLLLSAGLLDVSNVRAPPSELPVLDGVVRLLKQTTLPVLRPSAELTRQADVSAARAALAAFDPYGTVLAPAGPTSTSPLRRVLGGDGDGQRSWGALAVADSRKPGVLTVVEVDDGGAAAAAGLRVGDRVVRFDGLTATFERDGRRNAETVAMPESMPPAQRRSAVAVACLLRGSDGSAVAYVKIADFGPTAALDVEDALDGLQTMAGSPTDVIFDLRGNPGGYLDVAVETLSLVLPLGTFVADVAGVDLDGKPFATSYSTTGDRDVPRRLVVLVDAETRSAAEIFAAAVRASGRGVVVGAQTFGKGTAQELARIGGGQVVVRATTARFNTALGSIDGSGVRPDFVAENVQGDALTQLLVARGTFFDFAATFEAAHPDLDIAFSARGTSTAGTAEVLLQRTLDADLQLRLKTFLRRPDVVHGLVLATPRALDDVLLPDETRARAIEAFREAAQRGLSKDLGAASSDGVVLARAEEAVRARYQREGDRRAALLPRDAAVARALKLLRADDFGAPSARAVDEARPAAPLPVSGYDASAECLPLQTCDTREYVYVLPL
ncbi:ClpP/crotonase-like domain-containing protein [Pelagophyceae sp. CCMP2097]|nr:ClpP/crotonase-like domain-containing protein [Pelagophyceae sp. CCMP2097]